MNPSDADKNENPVQRTRLPLGFRRWKNWVVWLIFILALAHRLFGLAVIPAPHETNDEISALWAGMSMLSGEAPKSWSELNSSPDKILGIYSGHGVGSMPIVQPFFDHPPLFPLLVGITGKMADAESYTADLRNPDGATTLWDAPLWKLRLLPMLLFAASFWLLWGWLRLAMGPAAALVSVAFYGFVSTIVIHQRLLVSDNLITPLILAAFWSLERWRRGHGRPWVAAATVICVIALAVNSKLIALSAVAGVFAWSAAVLKGRRSLRPCVWAVGGAAIGLAGVLIFAASFGFNDFLRTMRAQSFRFYDLGGLFDAVRHQPIVNQEDFSCWLIAGWMLAFMGLATNRGGHRAVFAALLGYAVAFVFFVPVDLYGWHLLPFFPFLCAAWGSAIRIAWRRPDSPIAVFVMFLLVTAASEPFFQRMPSLRAGGRYAYMAFAVLILFPWGFTWDTVRIRVLRQCVAALIVIGLFGEAMILLADEIARLSL